MSRMNTGMKNAIKRVIRKTGKRIFIARNNALTSTSGEVPLDLFPCIERLRCAGVKLSMIILHFIIYKFCLMSRLIRRRYALSQSTSNPVHKNIIADEPDNGVSRCKRRFLVFLD